MANNWLCGGCRFNHVKCKLLCNHTFWNIGTSRCMCGVGDLEAVEQDKSKEARTAERPYHAANSNRFQSNGHSVDDSEATKSNPKKNSILDFL